MLLMGNKSAGAIFGTFICRFHILTALSEINTPLQVRNFYFVNHIMHYIWKAKSKQTIIANDCKIRPKVQKNTVVTCYAQKKDPKNTAPLFCSFICSIYNKCFEYQN